MMMRGPWNRNFICRGMRNVLGNMRFTSSTPSQGLWTHQLSLFNSVPRPRKVFINSYWKVEIWQVLRKYFSYLRDLVRFWILYGDDYLRKIVHRYCDDFSLRELNCNCNQMERRINGLPSNKLIKGSAICFCQNHKRKTCSCKYERRLGTIWLFPSRWPLRTKIFIHNFYKILTRI